MPSDSERLDELERQVRRQGDLIDILSKRLGIGQLDAAGMTSAGGYPDVIEAIRNDQLIVAIKLYREHAGVGLREAKDAVEALQRGL